MSKKAIANVIVGDFQIVKGKVYKDEEVKDFDQSNFVECGDEAVSEEVPTNEVVETATADMDSAPVEETTPEVSVEVEAPTNEVVETEPVSDFEKGV